MVDIKTSMIFSGNANKALAKSVAKNLGITLGKASVKTFSDGEISVEIEENVRGQDIYIIQPLCDPVNDNLMELLIICLLYTSPSPRDATLSRMPSSA